jgi:hypothetical protein
MIGQRLLEESISPCIVAIITCSSECRACSDTVLSGDSKGSLEVADLLLFTVLVDRRFCFA